MSTASATAGSSPMLTPTKYRAEFGPSGETFELVCSSRTAEDGKFRFVWTLAPGKRGPGEHYHEDETETFEIVSGTLRIWQDGTPNDYGPGETVVVAPRVLHRFLNPGTTPAVVNVSLDGPRMEDTIVPLSVASFGRKPRVSDMLRMLVTLPETRASLPRQRWLLPAFFGMARVLRLFGVKPFSPVIGWDR